MGSGPAVRRRLAAIWASIEGLRDHRCRYLFGGAICGRTYAIPQGPGIGVNLVEYW
jgi:hypothetical protein